MKCFQKVQVLSTASCLLVLFLCFDTVDTRLSKVLLWVRQYFYIQINVPMISLAFSSERMKEPAMYLGRRCAWISNPVITGPQMVQASRDPGRPLPIFSSKQLRSAIRSVQVAHGLSKSGSSKRPEMESAQCLWATCSAAGLPSWLNVLFSLNPAWTWASLVSVYACYLVRLDMSFLKSHKGSSRGQLCSMSAGSQTCLHAPFTFLCYKWWACKIHSLRWAS